MTTADEKIRKAKELMSVIEQTTNDDIILCC